MACPAIPISPRCRAGGPCARHRSGAGGEGRARGGRRGRAEERDDLCRQYRRRQRSRNRRARTRAEGPHRQERAIVAGPNCMGGNALHPTILRLSQQRNLQASAGFRRARLAIGRHAAVSRQVGRRSRRRFQLYDVERQRDCLDLADYVNFFVEDETHASSLCSSRIRRAPAFMAAAAKALAAGKPIVAIKTGKSQKSREAAQSHTGAISGDYDVFTAMCERYGITIVPSLDDMVEVMLAFQAGRLPKGPRVGWVTTSGGTVDLLYDYFEEWAGSAHRSSAPRRRRVSGPRAARTRAEEPARCRHSLDRCQCRGMCIAVAEDPNVECSPGPARADRQRAARRRTPPRARVDREARHRFRPYELHDGREAREFQ